MMWILAVLFLVCTGIAAVMPVTQAKPQAVKADDFTIVE
jgi:hypothetical protein